MPAAQGQDKELERCRKKIEVLERQLKWHETVRDWVSHAIVNGYSERRCIETLPEWVWLEGRNLSETYAEYVQLRHEVRAAGSIEKPEKPPEPPEEAPKTPIRHRFLAKRRQQ